ncbi:tRNA synthetases class I, catalytic domain-domain-containing protein [Catenaria anguillulae PL171]|uniref:glutamate--tRNA ligase n=1 Tax=Catenaria anguillulae PL171 TaxID=765915 RepID=A0A1Y2HWD4_9FUNG|nr:tRNA synthetases class I, catalytic domain-domain-containing protein [Catenaria anguillulae PL171]
MTSSAINNASCSLTVSAKDVPYGALVLALLANAAKPGSVLIAVKEDATTPCVLVSSIGLKFTKLAGVMRYLARVYLPDLYESHFGKPSPDKATTIDNFLSEQLPSDDLAALKSRLDHINSFLALRSFMVGYHLSLADFFLWSQLKSTPMFTSQLAKSPAYPFLLRWFRTVDDQPSVALALGYVQDQVAKLNKQKKDQGSFDIALPDAAMGNVVTRFPPEPSGYLHIGHAKAALMNEHFARKYNGKMIVRFDDTNPDKEKMEFEQSIMEDLALLGIKPDQVTHTSDHFPKLLALCEQMLRQGDAYVDDTDQETMRHQRMHGIASACRDNSIQENLRRWKEMQAGSDEGLRNCVRAKLSVDDKNKALRDPVLYRTNLTPHHKVGNKYKVYPTYDFACPVVDSIEGVTHALRTNEYRDRNPQYEWVISKLGLRKVHIWDFSRMNFVYTLLSKRKLQWFVDQGHVTGWDDPRFPTVRGIRRRGMTIEALRQYILMQGASTNTILLEWDKFWAVNKKVIDPIAPRHVGLDVEGLVPVTIVDGPATVEVKQVPKHKKNPDVGNKDTAYFKHIVLAGADVQDLADGEEVTLMDWGNVIVTKVHRDAKSGMVSKLDAKLNLAGDVKSTRKKLTWLVDASKVPKSSSSSRVSVPLTLKDFDYLITKKKLEEDDDFQSVLTPATEFVTKAVGDANLAKIRKGDIIQLERRGYYIADEVDAKSGHATLIAIPDGKAASLASKHGAATTAAASANGPVSAPALRSASRSRSKSPSRKAAKAPIMYPVANVYGDDGFPFDAKVFDIMYGVKSVYDKEH